jgi:hypothetical protein
MHDSGRRAKDVNSPPLSLRPLVASFSELLTESTPCARKGC